MATVRCPNCGAINPNGKRRLARCRSCREALTKCRYCQHYDARQLDCLNPSRPVGQRILDADEALNCPDFVSRLAASPAARPSSRLVPPLRSTALILLAGLIFAFGYFRYARPPATPAAALLVTSIGAPTTVFQEDGLDVTVTVVNQTAHPARDVRVRISGPGMSRLVCQSVNPTDCLEEAAPRHTSAWIGELAPGQSGAIGFHFNCQQTGTVTLAALVTASNVDVPSKAPIECEIVP